MRWLRHSLITLLLLLFLPPLMVACSGVSASGDWRTASRASTGLAPDPAQTPEAVIQVYAARTVSWRGIFGVHTWIATKEAGAPQYLVHHVLGWRVRRGQGAVSSQPDVPDRLWYGRRPELLLDLRGEEAAESIPRVLDAVRAYPYGDRYTIWPGPNSNTFTAFVARRVPELGLELPPLAIGKDYLGRTTFADSAPSGTGYQLSMLGAAGVTLARAEGLELNVLGLVVGVDPLRPAIKLPGIGRLGLPK